LHLRGGVRQPAALVGRREFITEKVNKYVLFLESFK
jgi:hypothetical protein